MMKAKRIAIFLVGNDLDWYNGYTNASQSLLY